MVLAAFAGVEMPAHATPATISNARLVLKQRSISQLVLCCAVLQVMTQLFELHANLRVLIEFTDPSPTPAESFAYAA